MPQSRKSNPWIRSIPLIVALALTVGFVAWGCSRVVAFFNAVREMESRDIE